MKARVPTPEQIDASAARVAEGRNPVYPFRANGPTEPPKLGDLIVRAEILLTKIERVLARYEASER
jgi:hypothetical protein